MGQSTFPSSGPSAVKTAKPSDVTPAFCPKRSILVGLFKFLAVGCGLNECSLSRTVSMISPKSSYAPEHSPIQIDNFTQGALRSTCWNRSIPPSPIKTRYHNTKHIAKPSDVNSCVLHQTQNPRGLIQVPRRWLRVKRMFAIANSVDDFSEIIVCAGAYPDSNRQLHPRRLAEHLLESVNTVKPHQNPISQHKIHRQTLGHELLRFAPNAAS